MQVLGAAYFGGCFAKPAAVLIHAGIDTHEVGAGQVDGYSEFIHRIAYIKRIKIEIIVWVVVGITPVEAVQYIVAAVAAYIHAVGGQAAAAECELAVVDPLWAGPSLCLPSPPRQCCRHSEPGGDMLCCNCAGSRLCCSRFRQVHTMGRRAGRCSSRRSSRTQCPVRRCLLFCRAE